MDNSSLLFRIYQMWRTIYSPDVPLIRLVSFAMEEIPTQQWMPIRFFANWLFHHEIFFDSGEAIQLTALIRKNWVDPLVELGFMQDMTSETGEVLVKWLIAPQRKRGDQQRNESVDRSGLVQEDFYVLPDFEVIVPPYTSLACRWELESIARFIRSDLVCVYYLTKESIIHAMKDGRTAGEILSFLEAGAKYELPDNVVFTIQSWAHSEEVLNTQTRGTSFSARLLESECTNPETSNEGIVFARFTPQFYELDTHIPSFEEVFPKLHEVPLLWLKRPRAYHLSTRKEILEKAIDWGTHVKIRRACEEIVFVPTSVIQQQMNWYVIGYEADKEIRLAIEQCCEMQLIVPGINDKN